MGLTLIDGNIVDTDAPKPRAEFYMHAKKVGVGQYKDVVYVKVRPVGAKDFVSHPATDEHKAEFPEAWEAFQKGEAMHEEQTALQLLKRFKPAFGMELKLAGIDSIEQLAVMPEPEHDYLKPLWEEARRYVAFMEQEND